MRRILSRSAGTTTSTDGQPATDQRSELTLEEAIAIIREENPSLEIVEASMWSGFRWRGQELWHELIHPLGFHFPLEAEQWDPETGSVKYLGRRCLICDAVC